MSALHVPISSSSSSSDDDIGKLLREAAAAEMGATAGGGGGGDDGGDDVNESNEIMQNVKELLSLLQGEDVNLDDIIESRDDGGWTALHRASKSGNVPVVDLLLQYDADAQCKTKKEGWTPLHLASYHGHADIVRRVLDHDMAGGDDDDDDDDDYDKGNILEERNENGHTALHLATFHDHSDVVKLLLGRNANVRARNKYGETPCHIAAFKGSTNVLRLLLLFRQPPKQGPYDGKKNARGNNAVVKSSVKSPVKSLLEETSRGGATPLHYAARYGQIDIVRLLLDHLSRHDMISEALCAKDDDGKTPLDWARGMRMAVEAEGEGTSAREGHGDHSKASTIVSTLEKAMMMTTPTTATTTTATTTTATTTTSSSSSSSSTVSSVVSLLSWPPSSPSPSSSSTTFPSPFFSMLASEDPRLRHLRGGGGGGGHGGYGSGGIRTPEGLLHRLGQRMENVHELKLFYTAASMSRRMSYIDGSTCEYRLQEALDQMALKMTTVIYSSSAAPVVSPFGVRNENDGRPPKSLAPPPGRSKGDDPKRGIHHRGREQHIEKIRNTYRLILEKAKMDGYVKDGRMYTRLRDCVNGNDNRYNRYNGHDKDGNGHDGHHHHHRAVAAAAAAAPPMSMMIPSPAFWHPGIQESIRRNAKRMEALTEWTTPSFSSVDEAKEKLRRNRVLLLLLRNNYNNKNNSVNSDKDDDDDDDDNNIDNNNIDNNNIDSNNIDNNNIDNNNIDNNNIDEPQEPKPPQPPPSPILRLKQQSESIVEFLSAIICGAVRKKRGDASRRSTTRNSNGNDRSIKELDAAYSNLLSNLVDFSDVVHISHEIMKMMTSSADDAVVELKEQFLRGLEAVGTSAVSDTTPPTTPTTPTTTNTTTSGKTHDFVHGGNSGGGNSGGIGGMTLIAIAAAIVATGREIAEARDILLSPGQA